MKSILNQKNDILGQIFSQLKSYFSEPEQQTVEQFIQTIFRDVAIAEDVRSRFMHVIPISPLSDLRPFLETSMNETLGLDDAEAIAESPITHERLGVAMTVWVGAEERPAFLDQARWLAEAWRSDLRIAPGRHHFDILDDLEHPDSPLVRSILGS